MARLSKVDSCLICDPDPCECGVKKKKTVKPRAKKPPAPESQSSVDAVGQQSTPLVAETAVAPVRRASMRAAMKAAAAAAPAEAPVVSPFDRGRTTTAGSLPADRVRSDATGSKPPSQSSPTAPPPVQEDTVLAMAIRNLAPILHEDELKKYEVIIGSQATLADKAAFWRASREEGSGGSLS